MNIINRIVLSSIVCVCFLSPAFQVEARENQSYIIYNNTDQNVEVEWGTFNNVAESCELGKFKQKGYLGESQVKLLIVHLPGREALHLRVREEDSDRVILVSEFINKGKTIRDNWSMWN